MSDGYSATTQGAIVTHVTPRSPACGIREGDLITKVRSKNVSSADQALQAITKQGENPVRLSVTNADSPRFVPIKPEWN